MASGYFTGSTGNKYITARITWSSVSDTVNNRSLVTATLSYAKSSNSTGSTYGTGAFSIVINGSAKSFTLPVTLNPNDTWVTIGSHSVYVPHNADGSKSVSISATGGISGLTFSTTNCSATVILDKIPRATTPTFGAATQTIGSSMTINLPAADSTFHHTVSYSWGPTTSGTIATKAQRSIAWAIPMSFCNGVPNGTQGTLFVTVETFTSNGVSLGVRTVSTPCNVPASVVPTISAITLSDTGAMVPDEWNTFVQYKSRLHVNVNASGAYGSTIKSYAITALGTTVSSNNRAIGVINDHGDIPVTVKVTDSRGRTASITRTITVLAYEDPTIAKFSIERANSYGTPTDNGDFAKIYLEAYGSALNNLNTVTAAIYHKRSDLSEWTLARTIPVEYNIDDTIMIGDMVTSRSYAMRIELMDAFGTSIADATLKAEGAVMGWYPGGIGISFGKAAEEEYTADFDWTIHGRKDARFDGDIRAKGLLTLQTADIASLSLGGTNQSLGATGSYVKVAFTKFGYNLTDALTINSNGILIPAGVRAVRVSAQICVGGSTGIKYAQISANSWNDTVARAQKYFANASYAETIVIPATIMTVNEGDIIMLGVYGNSADTIYGNHNQTYLAVEAFV